jgi:hypothetical protein
MMRHVNKYKNLLTRFSIAALLLAFFPLQALAGQITLRSVTLGTSAISTAGTNLINFTVPNVGSGNVGSINFQYCTAATGTCTMPTTMISTSATLSAQSGATGFTIVATTNGAPYITRTAATITAGTALSYTLSNVTNTATLGTFYIRVTTYTAAALGGSVVDAGVVAASTANQIVLNATVPETLSFCVYNTGGTCADASTSVVNLGVLSAASTGTGTSKFQASTNAATGYIVTVNGTTLTSGSNTIAAYAALTATPAVGTSGFGMNLRADTTPSVASSADVAHGTAPAIGAYGTNYGTVNSFSFTTGDTIFSAAGPSNTDTFTAAYIANMGGAQAAGLYTTTLTYVCTATF